MMLGNKNLFRVGVMLLMAAMIAMPIAAQADRWGAEPQDECNFYVSPDPATESQVCTNQPELAERIAKCKEKSGSSRTPGLLSNITKYIKDTVNSATQSLYQAFTNSNAYQGAVMAAATLMIIIYALAFMIGVVQASFGETLKRLVKLGIIFSLISPAGWDFFNGYVVHFFNDGSDQLIGGVMAIGTGGTYDPALSPFQELDDLAAFVLQPDTLVAVMGSVFAGGPFGFAMGGLMSIAVFGLLKMILEALKTYSVSFVVRSLLLGVAPIFIVFLLFDRTKPLFTGWLNALINLSLQPILYFTFLSFFIVMIMSSATDMLGAKLCWTEFRNTSGSQNKISFWRYIDPATKSPMTDEMTWQGQVSCLLNPDPKNPCKPFPINIIDILSFLILVFIASKFASVIDNIAAEISNAAVNLDKDAKLGFNMEKQASDRANSQPSAATKPQSDLQTGRTGP